MKIALISFHSFYQPGGVKRHILGLAKEFRKRGVEVKIIVPRRKRHENYGKDVILLGTSFPVVVGGTETDLVINFNPLAIENVLKKEKFDILHFHNFTPPSAFQILERSELLNIVTIHANIEKSKFLKRSGFLYLCKRIIQWKVDGLIGVASLTLKGSEGFKGPKTVIPNGIDLDEFNPRVSGLKKFSDEKINILFLGRIEERKGLIYLLRAYKILEKTFLNTELPSVVEARGKKRAESSSPLRLIVAGEGSLKSYLEKWVKENKLKNIIFEGKVPEDKVASFYKSCDIFCSPAIFGESFGLVLVEAMACGKPVVAFANEGYKGVLGDTKGARFLVKPKDYKALAKKLEILIKNPRLRKEMGQWGIEEAKKYSWEKIADQILDFYQICLKERRKQRKNFPLELEKSFNKILNRLYDKKILNWLKYPK
ncbi:MAG TPA: glycosyltransferase family 4 protein [Candidatus Humimicrobiaceae bacterium]|nr:glycosyltransferase family 4 protein [Candidatus Humimicrobiaceae bacterium]